MNRDALNEQLKWYQHHDALTGLQNYECLEQNAYNYIDAPVYALYIHFDMISYFYADVSFKAGNEALIKCSDVLKKHFDEQDIYKVSYDACVVMITRIDQMYIVKTIDNIRDDIKKITILDSSRELSMHVGFMIDKPKDYADIERLVQDAQKAEIKMHIKGMTPDYHETKKIFVGDEEDKLTGLMNMNSFVEFASRVKDTIGFHDKKLLVIYFNITNFKKFNQTHGFEKGDEVLKEMGHYIEEVYSPNIVARFGEDHFGVFTYENHVIESITSVVTHMSDLYPKYDLIVKAGVYVLEEEDLVSLACDKAKIACDSIRVDPTTNYRYYDQVLDDEITLTQYITDHIDEAIEKEYLKVYFQSVIRANTNKVCGLEALARWDDPIYGFMNPGKFISILESQRLIHKLDVFMIRKICQNFHSHNGKITMVPCSFNLSRLDFELCDIFSEVEKAITDYEVPRNMIHIEITESVLSSDPEFVKDELDKFHDAGYEIWMDDFGSGYSSLNVLKDYRFDTLKIDMEFLTDFSKKSQSIVASIIDMAKRLHIRTLAEGVETIEQVQFLKDINCEMIQGYYFGAPMAIDVCIDHCVNVKQLGVESRIEALYASKISNVNVLSSDPFGEDDTRVSSIPLAIFELYDGHFKLSRFNQKFEEVLETIGDFSIENIESKINDPNWKYASNIGDSVMEAKEGEIRLLDLIEQGSYVIVTIKVISDVGEHKALLVSLENITESYEVKVLMKQHEVSSSIYSMYELVDIIHYDTSTTEIIYSNAAFKGFDNNGDYKKNHEDFALRCVYKDDRIRYLDFMDYESIVKRLKASEYRTLSSYFRMKITGANYEWRQMTISLMESDATDILVCVRNVDEKAGSQLLRMHTNEESQNDSEITKSILWDTMKDELGFGVFWKDTSRRFVGVNQMFLDYYNIDSIEDVVGKNDEEMGWHVNPDPFKNDEYQVIHNGTSTKNVPGFCISKGENRRIAASKFPIYNNGKVVGLLGYFIDVTQQEEDKRKLERLAYIDEVTGLLNGNGLVNSYAPYIESYNLRQLDFGMIDLEIDNFKHFYDSFGATFSNMLLIKAGQAIKKIVGNEGIVARTTGSQFVIIKQFASRSELHELAKKIKEALSKIKEVETVPVTPFIYLGLASYSECDDIDKLSNLAETRMLVSHERHVIELNKLHPENQEIYYSDEALFDRLKVLRTVFDIIRLVNPKSSTAKVLSRDGTYFHSPERCYGFFNRNIPCSQCISMKTITDHETHSKIEYRSNTSFEIISEYVVVNGEEYALEMIKRLDKSI